MFCILIASLPAGLQGDFKVRLPGFNSNYPAAQLPPQGLLWLTVAFCWHVAMKIPWGSVSKD